MQVPKLGNKYMRSQLNDKTNDIVSGTQIIPFLVWDAYFLRMSVENTEMVLTQWDSEPWIWLHCSFLHTFDWSTLTVFREKSNSTCLFLICLIFVYLSKVNYFAHICFLFFNHKTSCQSQSRTNASENPRGKPNKGLLGLFW